MGCLGPSRGRCNTTISEDFDFGANWCGSGCGFDVCVQPGTDPDGFYAYLNQFETGLEVPLQNMLICNERIMMQFLSFLFRLMDATDFSR